MASTARPTLPDPRVLAAQVDSIVQVELLAQGTPSVSVAIMRGDDMVLARAWGLADAVSERKAEPSTPYQLGSVSKTFTAALILKLADRRKLSITDPISRHFAGLRPEWQAITIEQLLNHTSGLKTEFRQEASTTDPVSRDALWAMAARDTLASTPGTTFLYSNTGYMVLGALIERLYGKPYADVLRDEIAKPLGLQSLHFCGLDDPRVARGHTRVPDGKATHLAPFHPSILLGNGGVCATPSDIVKFNRALHGGRVLSSASYAAMTTPRGAAVGNNYGLGLSVRSTRSGATVMLHEGTTRGYAATNAWYPAESLSAVVVYNGSPRVAKDVAGIVSTLARGLTPQAAAVPAPQAPPQAQSVPVTKEPAPLAPADAGRFAGEYEMVLGANITVSLNNGVLWAKPPAAMGGSGQALVHKSGTSYGFGRVDAPTTFTFVLDDAGVVTAARLPMNGTERTLPKVR
jgi:CubicO group peptidase (beta-lactamase class C family)